MSVSWIVTQAPAHPFYIEQSFRVTFIYWITLMYSNFPNRYDIHIRILCHIIIRIKIGRRDNFFVWNDTQINIKSLPCLNPLNAILHRINCHIINICNNISEEIYKINQGWARFFLIRSVNNPPHSCNPVAHSRAFSQLAPQTVFVIQAVGVQHSRHRVINVAQNYIVRHTILLKFQIARL